MSERDFMLKKLMEARFSLLEITLYLDTHPSDREALAAFGDYREKYLVSRREFEKKFGPLTPFSENPSETSWCWVNDPWPWQ